MQNMKMGKGKKNRTKESLYEVAIEERMTNKALKEE
jgi:hypothetical protein